MYKNLELLHFKALAYENIAISAESGREREKERVGGSESMREGER